MSTNLPNNQLHNLVMTPLHSIAAKTTTGTSFALNGPVYNQAVGLPLVYVNTKLGAVANVKPNGDLTVSIPSNGGSVNIPAGKHGAGPGATAVYLSPDAHKVNTPTSSGFNIGDYGYPVVTYTGSDNER